MLLKEEEEEEVFVPDIAHVEHCWLADSLDESKRQSTMISKDKHKIELVIESRIAICGDQMMTHGIYYYVIDLNFFLGNIFVGVSAYQGLHGGNPMLHEFVHGRWDDKFSVLVTPLTLIFAFTRLGYVWCSLEVWGEGTK